MSRVVIANYDYVADNEDAGYLSFYEGDRIIVLHEHEPNGWWTGILQRTGQRGYFPATYVSYLDDEKEEEKVQLHPTFQPSQESISSVSHSSVSKHHMSKHITLTTKYSTESEQAESNTVSSEHEKTNMHSIPDPQSENYYSTQPLNLKTNPNAKTRYGVAAHYMSEFASICTIFCSISAYLWSIGSEYLHKLPKFGMIPSYAYYQHEFDIYAAISVYGFLIGWVMLLWEVYFGFARSKQCAKALMRCTWYLLIGLPLLLTLPTALCGVLWLNTAVFSALAWKNNEVYECLKKKKRAQTGNSQTGCNICSVCKSIRQQSKLQKYSFLAVYILFNVAYTLYWIHYYYGVVDQTNELAISGEDDTLTLINERNGDGNVVLNYWFPVAKGFGNLLDVNCAFILLPVCRTFISKLYNISTDQRCTARFFNFVLSFIPLDKALQFHKLCAFLIVIGSIFHSFAHLNQIAFVPASYEAIYGLTVWISGILIILIMHFIYSSSFAAVRTGKFEFFWYTHHLFILFFIAVLFHGKNSINPNFWKWFLVPGFIYILERIIREVNGRKSVGVISILHMNNKTANVFCLELEKTGPIKHHKEGQYVFIKVPFISKYQWHPFTISSPPEQNTLTLHIRNMGDGTWTDRVQTFFQAMAPNKAYTELYHRSGNSLIPQTIGPDGKQLICIDGPMAAPTQHLGEYSTSIVVGAGIGVTPLRATLLSIIYYRFKRGVGRSFPDHSYSVWIVNYKQLEAYRFMCRTLKEISDELYNMGDLKQSNKSIQIHIFVTSVPDSIPAFNEAEVLNLENDKQKDLALWGQHYDQMVHESLNSIQHKRVRAPFNEIDIWKCLKQPSDDPVQIGHICIHKGRPTWDNIFAPIQQKYVGNNIGVLYCGPVVIASELKRLCGKYTDLETKTRFVLHKENF